MSARIGVIGCKGNHAEGIIDSVHGEYVACADLDGETARTFADEYGGAWYTDHQTMIAEADLDGVTIATPSGTHADLAIDAMEAGAHVLCEKPLDVYIDRVDEMVETATREDVILAGIFQRRGIPAHQRAREAIQAGELGQPVLGDVRIKWYRTDEYYAAADWKGTRALDGGCMMNQGIHEIDLLQWLMGGIESVYAYTDTICHDIEMEDVGVVAVAFENGAYGTIEATTCAPDGRGRSGVEIDGTEGSYVPGDQLVTADGEIDLDDLPDPDPGARNGQLADFAAAIIEGREPMVPGHEARNAVEVVLACYASATLDRRVELAELRDLQEHT